MKGDFSKGADLAVPNDLGLLYQQGRVIRDADLTEAELIAQRWRETAARDVIGAHVAAVPADAPQGYFVEAAAVHDAHVDVRLSPGRIWADGIHLTLPPAAAGAGAGASPTFAATYLAPPANPAGTDVAGITDAVRDAVILEVAVGALNGFQEPERLIEPALGGPDTAERLHPHQAIRLLRLAPGEDCTTIAPRLRDDLATHGRLSVTLEPPTVIAGDCPVVEGGGYAGFEHNLYRIEMAQTSGPAVMFKWSRMNGGLVGRGRFFGGADPRVEISANRTAILNSGLTEYYLEALVFDAHRGHWRVVYGTTASLNADGQIDLVTPAAFGTMPGAGGTTFFRLWDGILPIAGFAAAPAPLRDGIELHFPSPPASYVPGDFWTFDLRAGEIANPQTLHDTAPPMGPQMRRVPLAEVTWTDRRDTDVSGSIEDCRRRFRPLTNQKICCTYLVGNGTTSFGDFNTLEEAVAHLPPQGGKICLLPGLHFANLTMTGRTNVMIHGCRTKTMLLPRLASFAAPIIRLEGGAEIEIADLDFFAPFGIAIDAAGTPAQPLRGLRATGCRILSLTYGMRLEWLEKGVIAHNHIWLLDHIDALSAVSLRGTDMLVERNAMGVWPFEFKPPIPGDDPDDTPPDPADPCIEPEDLYANLGLVVGYVVNVWLTLVTAAPQQPYRARGGLHLRGACARVDVTGNRIDGGAGHGITLGGAYQPELPAAAAAAAPEAAAASDALPTVQVTDRRVLEGLVTDPAGQGLEGVVLTLRQSDGSSAGSGLTEGSDGKFAITAPAGTYRLAVQAGYEIASVATLDGLLFVTLRPAAAEARPDAAFLYQVRILDNTVERMALSGIGFLFHGGPPASAPVPASFDAEELVPFLVALIAPRELIGTTNLVRDLVIRGNRIQNNLRAVFTKELQTLGLVIGQGGISLALVEGLRIEDNQIVGNGLRAADPCTGIFCGYVEEARITGNYIAGNGPLGTDYETAAIEGLRGGIFVRLASAVVEGGAADAYERPALTIDDNHIDQPAGRAITAFAYGPVTCNSNHLNSERAGRWGFVDRFVGGVLLVNLGGIHRHFETQPSEQFTTGAEVEAAPGMVGMNRYTAGLAADVSAEALLPGGEVLFNSNRIRLGGAHESYTSQLILTLDDLGYDANQSTMFRPDLAFANLLCAAQSLRVTDSRFRERARRVAMSVVTWAFGWNDTARTYAMNLTTQNQADHCIIALSNGPPIGQQVIDQPNQVVFGDKCPITGLDNDEGKMAYLMDVLIALVRLESRGSVDPERDAPKLGEAIPAGYDSMAGFHTAMLPVQAREVTRLEQQHGRDAALSLKLRSGMSRKMAVAGGLRRQVQLAAVTEAPVSETGKVLDGRVTDAASMALAGADVELVDGAGRSLGVRTRADASGYYALSLDDATLERLAQVPGVSLQVTGPDKTSRSISAAALLRADAGKARRDVVIADLPGRTLKTAGRTVIFTAAERPLGDAAPSPRPVPRAGATAPVPSRPDAPVPLRPDAPVPLRPAAPVPSPRDAEPAAPSPAPVPPAPTTPAAGPGDVPLEAVPGVGAKLAERLREAGLTDARRIVSASVDDLQAVLGSRARTILSAAEEALRRRFAPPADPADPDREPGGEPGGDEGPPRGGKGRRK